MDLDVLNPLQMEGIKEEKQIAQLAKRILKVYGDAETPTLYREIRRMSQLLDIPVEEVLKHG